MSQSIRKKLIKDAGYFHNKGWMCGTAGNLSAKPNKQSEFWITASGCSKGVLGLTDFVKMNLQGELLAKIQDECKTFSRNQHSSSCL